jgi:hypothetical protein
VPKNDERQKEAPAPSKPGNTKRRRLDIAVIVMLSVVTLMVIALLVNLLTTLRL